MHILLADDQPIVRMGFMSLLENLFDNTVFHEAGDERAALHLASMHQPRVGLIDLSLSGNFTLELIKTLRKEVPEMPILVVSNQDEMHYAERALKAGATGYVMKQRTPESIYQAVQVVSQGEIWLSENIRNRLIKQMINGRKGDLAVGVESLSDRELMVFRMIGSGLKKSDIARELNLSPNTIETYRSHIKQKLDIATGAELMRVAFLQFQEERPARRKPGTPRS